MSVRTEPRDLSAQLQQTLTIPAEVMASHNPQMMAPVPTASSMEGAMVAAQGPSEQQLHEANSFNTTNEHHPLERTVCINIRASLSDLCFRANAATWSPPSAEATKSIFQQARVREPAPRTAPTLVRQPPASAVASEAEVAFASRARHGPISTHTHTHTLQPHTPSRTLRPTVPPCGRRAQRKFLDLGGSAENQGDLRSVVLHKMTLQAQKSSFPIALGVRITGVDDSAFSKTGGLHLPIQPIQPIHQHATC